MTSNEFVTPSAAVVDVDDLAQKIVDELDMLAPIQQRYNQVEQAHREATSNLDEVATELSVAIKEVLAKGIVGKGLLSQYGYSDPKPAKAKSTPRSSPSGQGRTRGNNAPRATK